MSYMAVVLTEESQNHLVATFEHMWGSERGWKTFAHHLTMHMGKAKEEEQILIGEFATLVVDAVAGNEMVKAVRVVLPEEIQTKNDVPHITLAVNREAGGKPVMSNQLKDWEPVDPIRLRGRVEEVS